VGVEKTIRFISPETIEVAYRVATGAAPGRTSSSGADSPISFESVMGVPVVASGEEQTEFCWQAPTAETNAKPQCEVFTRNDGEIHVPEGVTHIEVRAKNHPSLAVEWTAGSAIIVPKAFSTQIKLVFPPALRADEILENTLRFTVVPEP
jgi:hypothetical protein